jgi:hypothetical protein
MMGGPVGTVAPDFKNAFFDMAEQLLGADPDTAAVLVVFGQPGTLEPDDIIKIGRVEARQDPATLSTNRAREESLTLEVTISCYRGGGAEMERVASDRAYDLLRRLAEQVRKVDTTLGGVVRQCFLTSSESDGATDPNDIAQGRTIDVVATFTAAARVTN